MLNLFKVFNPLVIGSFRWVISAFLLCSSKTRMFCLQKAGRLEEGGNHIRLQEVAEAEGTESCRKVGGDLELHELWVHLAFHLLRLKYQGDSSLQKVLSARKKKTGGLAFLQAEGAIGWVASRTFSWVKPALGNETREFLLDEPVPSPSVPDCADCSASSACFWITSWLASWRARVPDCDSRDSIVAINMFWQHRRLRVYFVNVYHFVPTIMLQSASSIRSTIHSKSVSLASRVPWWLEFKKSFNRTVSGGFRFLTFFYPTRLHTTDTSPPLCHFFFGCGTYIDFSGDLFGIVWGPGTLWGKEKRINRNQGMKKERNLLPL